MGGSYGPGGGGFDRFGPVMEQHGAWGTVMHLLPLLLFVVAIGVAIWAVLRFTSRPAAVVGAPAGPQPVPLRPDPAVDELRIRYARGEVTREEFLTRVGDLGADPGVGDDAPQPPEPGG